MPKRSFWTVVGYSAGVATSVAVQRRVKRTVAKTMTKLGPSALVDRAKQLTVDLRSAASEGRAAMRESELRLGEEFGAAPRRARNHVPRRDRIHR